MVEASTITVVPKKNTLLPPPRRTGAADIDTQALYRWVTGLYDLLAGNDNPLGVMRAMIAETAVQKGANTNVAEQFARVLSEVDGLLEGQMTERCLYVDRSTSVGGTSAAVLAANAQRKALIFSNTHATQSIWLNLTGGTAAANTVPCILLAAGATLRFDLAVPTNPVTAIASGSSTGLTVLEA